MDLVVVVRQPSAEKPDHPVTGQYRIDFVLTTLTGNLGRYRVLRKFVAQDHSVRARWYPIRTWVANDPFRFLPGAVRVRVRNFLDAWRLFVRPPAQAVVFHAGDTHYLFALFSRLLRRRTIIVEQSDFSIAAAPHGRLSTPLCRFAVRQTALFVPWSRWVAELMRQHYPGLPAQRIQPMHPGIDLATWPLRQPRNAAARWRLLFVGGDLVRKGITTLLDAYERCLSDNYDLVIATQSNWLTEALEQRIRSLAGVELHLDLSPGSAALHHLYDTSDIFVLPTEMDASPFVALEAMASGLPVVICPVGGIPDIVRDKETGLLIPPKDPAALAAAVEGLRTDPEVFQQIVAAGRALIEEEFSAQKNTARLLGNIRALIDNQKESATPKAGPPQA